MCPFFISTHRWKTHSFYLALPLFSLNFPLSSIFPASPPLRYSRGTAYMPGGWQREPVRLSSWGFHLVIFPLGIHTTPLPPEASCLNTDSPKETSRCHFSSHTLVARFLALISPSSLMSFYLFLAYSLLCCLSSCPSLCLPMFCHPPPPSSLIVCAFLIVLELSVVTDAEMAAGAICGEQLIWLRSQGHIHNNILLPLELTGLSGFMSEWAAHKQSCAFVFAETLLT